MRELYWRQSFKFTCDKLIRCFVTNKSEFCWLGQIKAPILWKCIFYVAQLFNEANFNLRLGFIVVLNKPSYVLWDRKIIPLIGTIVGLDDLIDIVCLHHSIYLGAQSRIPVKCSKNKWDSDRFLFHASNKFWNSIKPCNLPNLLDCFLIFDQITQYAQIAFPSLSVLSIQLAKYRP